VDRLEVPVPAEPGGAVVTSERGRSCRATTPRGAFTLIELLVVIGVVVAIMGLTIPAVQAVREGQRRSASEALLSSINEAMGQHRSAGVTARTASGSTVTYPLWDFDQNGILDGDPARDPDFSVQQRTAATSAGYGGAASVLGLTLGDHQIDSHGRIIDAWGQPLRVQRYPAEGGKLWVWSTGPDLQVDPDGIDNDLKPWRTTNDR
jgi:type II secretory pathway pseudopilin PulG